MSAHRTVMRAIETLDWTSLMRDVRPVGGTTVLATRAVTPDARLYVILHFQTNDTDAVVLMQTQSFREALRKYHEVTA